MRTLIACILVAVFLVGLTGCSGLSETPKERKARIELQRDKEMEMAVEDWDRFWLNNRPSRLSPNNI